VVGIHGEPLDTNRLAGRQGPLHQRPVEQRNQRLRQAAGQGAQSRAQPGTENERLMHRRGLNATPGHCKPRKKLSAGASPRHSARHPSTLDCPVNESTTDANPSAGELEALVRLLDDDTPEVRAGVAARLAACAGDLSEWLASRKEPLPPKDLATLSLLLEPSRRETLAREWQAPGGGAGALDEDWDGFEAMLRLLSDFLHDGVTLRQPLSDALDLLADEAQDHGVTSADELRAFLFEQDRLAANADDTENPANLDLAWAVSNGRSNPLGLTLIFMLVAKRLDLEVEPINFPGHFLCRIFKEGYPVVIDCFDHGRQHLEFTLMESPDLNRKQRECLRRTASLGEVMRRVLDDLAEGLDEWEHPDDATLIRRLRKTLA
jgi:hypothetical protein